MKIKPTKQVVIKNRKPRRILAIEQFRYCTALSRLQEADAQSISDSYARARGEEENYIKTYTQLSRLEKAKIVERRTIHRPTPPHNAIREVSLWTLTEYGKEILNDSAEHYRIEYERLQNLAVDVEKT